MVRLLKLSLVTQGDAIPAEGNLLAGGVIPPDERRMGSSGCKNYGISCCWGHQRMVGDEN